MSATKKCPFCAEDIQAAAVKCKHCGSELNGATRPAAVHSTGGGAAPKAIGAVVLIVGMFVAIGGDSAGNDTVAAIGGVMCAGGFIAFVVGRFMD